MKITIQAIKAKLRSIRTGSGDEAAFKDMGILDHIEKIVEISKKYGIDKCLNRGKSHFAYITQKLGISPLQAVLFSHFMERSADSRINISEIAESIKCSTVRIIKYMNECEELEKKKLIRCSRGSDTLSYRVPLNVRDSLRKFNEFRPEKIEDLSITQFFAVLRRLFEERSDNELTFDTLNMELKDLISLNMHLLFCKKIISYGLYEDDLVLLLCFCHLAGNNSDDNIGFHDFEFLYGGNNLRGLSGEDVALGFRNGSHTLIHGKFIEFTNNDGFVNSESWKLSDKAKKELLSELKIKTQTSYEKNLILFKSIKGKKMFYNARETEAIQKLTSLLQEKNYRKIQARLDGKGMRKGFACLFSGSPGTGKTETAYQIARATKRNIMMIDISETKSCWYGESEKKIKEVFDTYRSAVENSKIAPILLLNEADGVIAKRVEIGSNNPSLEKTENTIQNIILQEMETLSGILIATTNLTQNMDSAFERRFLYKINFERPSPESRAGIWNSLLPALPESHAVELSKRFDLSGGQIENIARKTEVDAIISGRELSLDTLLQYCKDETQNSFNASKRIGFANE